MAERRGEAIRQASRLTRIPGNSSTRERSFCDTISSIQQLTRSLDDQRRLHLLLTNRRKALLKQLRHRPPVTISISSSTLEELAHTNYYDPLMDDIDQLPPAGGDHNSYNTPPPTATAATESDAAGCWSPRRTRHSRPSRPKSTTTPMDITLAHAKELTQNDPPPLHLPTVSQTPDHFPLLEDSRQNM